MTDLIENRKVDKFYVGNNGAFDRIVVGVLRELKHTYSYITFSVVLSNLSEKCDCEETIYPEGLENTPPRFAIDKRNRWMVSNSDMAVVYVVNNWGGAYKFKTLSEKKGLEIINLV